MFAKSIANNEPHPELALDPATCEKARLSRDARFDGRFFVGVTTTGIYCRPICPVKAPRSENTIFYPTAAAAAGAGFRPCLRCRPETSPGTPAWLGTNATVQRAMRMIAQGVLDNVTLEEFCARLGVGSRHLLRLFMRHVGTSPAAVARTRRLHYAKKLLDETDLPMADLALAAGYGSVRRFNDEFKRGYGTAPSTLRKRKPHPRAHEDGYEITLDYRPPYDWEGVLSFLETRATPGVEWVRDGEYGRSFRVSGPGGVASGTIAVRHAAKGNRLLCRISTDRTASLVELIEAVKRMFDVGADPREINTLLGRDPALAPVVRKLPGIRIPGSWDGFETAVRAVIGQQVSVAGARTTTARLVERFGKRLAPGSSVWLFPTPDALGELTPAEEGMPATKVAALRSLAQAVASGELRIERSMDPEELTRQLCAIRGIGPWTASYIAMRYLGEPDAFPHPDLVLIAEGGRLLGIEGESRQLAKALLARVEQWRPWRAYGALHLWRSAAER